jgi:hypothetical protein
MLQKFKMVMTVGFLSILSGCGGGGDMPLQTTGLPVAATFENIFTSSGVYSASTTDGATTLTLTITPSEDGQFSQSTAKSRVVNFSRVIKQNGTVIDTQQSSMYFNILPLRFVAVEGKVVDTSSAIPSIGDVNASSRAYMSEGIGRGLFSTPPQEGTWSLEQASGKVFLCLTNKLGFGLLSAPGSETTTITTYCFGVNGSGRTSAFKASQTTDENSTGSTSVVETISFQ